MYSPSPGVLAGVSVLWHSPSLGVLAGVNVLWHSPRLVVLAVVGVLWHSPSLGVFAGVNVLWQPKTCHSCCCQCTMTRTAQALVFLLVSMRCDTAQALLFLLVSVCCDTAQALLLVSMCCDTAFYYCFPTPNRWTTIESQCRAVCDGINVTQGPNSVSKAVR